MSLSFATYVQAAGGCSGGAGRGTQAFASYLEFMYSEQFSLGMYVCRRIAGVSLLSSHAKGRAYDQGLKLVGAQQPNPLGVEIINRVCEYGEELGIDHAIFNLGGSGRGRPWIWNKQKPAGEPYQGVHPHKNHIHWGLTVQAARNLTWGTLDHYLGAEMTDAEWVRMSKLIDARLEAKLGKTIALAGEPNRRTTQAIVNGFHALTRSAEPTSKIYERIESTYDNVKKLLARP